jgi:rhodanese-related sulfurtransferase
MQFAVPEITVQEAKRLLDSPRRPRLIDVREADEWETCRVTGAEHLPLSQWPDWLSKDSQTSPSLCSFSVITGHAPRTPLNFCAAMVSRT